MKNIIPRKFYRFEVDDIGIYEAVDRDCPKDDKKRNNKPDGSWLNKAGPDYPNSISFWTLEGLMKYFSSGLLNWHVNVVKGDIVVKVTKKPNSVDYIDDDQIILKPDELTVIEEIPFDEFEKQLKVSEDLIYRFNESVKKIYETLGEPSIDPKNPGNYFKKYEDNSGNANMNLVLRNIPTSHRLFYFKDRVVDACFNFQILNGDIEIESDKVNDQFIKSGAIYSLIDNTYVAIKSLMNHLAYFFNIEYLDEELSELEFINAVDLEDKNIKLIVNEILKSSKWQNIKGYKLSKDSGSLGMTRLAPVQRTEDKIKLDMQNSNSQDAKRISKTISLYLVRLVFTVEVLAEYLFEEYSATRGYTRQSDISVKTDKKTSNLKRSNSKDQTKKLFKIYNLQLNKPKEIKIAGYRLKRSPEFDELKKSFYRGAKSVSQTISQKKYRPIEVRETVISENEGDMLWTHTLVLDDYKKEDKKMIKEKVETYSLLLSLLTGKAVYTEESKFRHSHKAYVAGRTNSIDIESGVNHALNKLEELDNEDYKSFLLSQLFEYRGIMQNTSFDKQIVDLWSLVDKFAHFSLGDKKYKLDSETRKKIENTVLEIAPGDKQEQKRLINAITREYSLFRRIREYIFDCLRLHKKSSVDRKEFKKVVSNVYSYRSDLTHQSKYSVNKEDLTELSNYYRFLSNLVLLIFLEELGIEVKHSKTLLLKELKGFIDNPQKYYKERNKQLDERHKKLQDLMEYLSGNKPLPPGKTTITF